MEALYKPLLERCKTYVSTAGMSREQWLTARRGSIGGSDAGAVMGLNKWASALTVYLDKKGLRSFAGNTATERGTWLEEPIRQKSREMLKCPMEAVPFMFTSDAHPFMSANIDGIIYFQEEKEINRIMLSGFGGHEIKTTQSGDDFDENEIPDSYFAQVQHYMAVLGLPWFIVSAYFIEKNEFCHYVVQRDDAFIARLIEAEKDFWQNFVEKDIMPPLAVSKQKARLSTPFLPALQQRLF